LADLAAEAPLFQLPPATLGHTRHYMPWFKKGPQDKTLVFDAFVSVSPDAEVVFHWRSARAPSAQGRRALDLVLSRLSYLGRAESWSTARLLEEFDQTRINCWPGQPRRGWETTRVLVADAGSWNAWTYQDKKVVKPSPVWNLLAETADMQREGWSDPPGSRWVTYARPSDSFRVAWKPRARFIRCPMPTIARYSLDGPVLPPIGMTLPLAEAMRRALMSRYRKLKEIERYGRTDPPNAERIASSVFSGKDERGEPLQDEHAHAFYMPTDEDDDGRLDHVTVHAPGGFPREEVRAVDALRWLRCGDLDLALLLVGLGKEAEFRHTRVLGKSAVWISSSPFLVTRHLKRRGRKRDPRTFFETPEGRADFVKQVLREELERRGLLQDGLEIEQLETVGRHPPLRPLQFRLGRRKPGDNGSSRSRGLFRLRFPRPVAGPIALGHSCHFGLGLFLPE
jgi:CRISPR-associated protein Csb2